MMHDLGFPGSWGMLGGPLLMGFLWLVPILIVGFAGWWLVRRAGRPEAPSSPNPTLEERYARGEIGREEYLEKLADLARGSRV
jgi:putative membrane protein